MTHHMFEDKKHGKKASTPNHLLIKAREDRKWTQEDVADELQTSPNNISRWERGIVVPHPRHREALCELFGLSETQLGLTRPAKTVLSAIDPSLVLLDPLIPSLPSDIHTLVGRKQELSDMQDVIAQHPPSRPAFVALYGTPGVGKTALMTTLAHDALSEQDFDGVLWGGVGPKPSIQSILSRWGTLLNIESRGTKVEELLSDEEWRDALTMAIGSRRLLIVLDDVWNAEDARKLTIGGPNCVHIMTTRHAKLALDYAGNAAMMIHELDTHYSVAMLHQLIPNVVEVFDDEPNPISALVDAVGGLPLALLITGKYLQVEAARGQQRRLRDALRKLSEPTWRLHLTQIHVHRHDTTPDIPLSVQAAIALSDRHLGEQEQRALRMLAIFPHKPNTFSERAALAVADTTPDVLDRLADASLLEVATDTERYTLHQTIADYARLQPLQSLEDSEAAKRRLAIFFVGYIEQQRTVYPALTKEMDNILLALHIAREQALTTLFIRGATMLTPFLLARGLYTMARFHLTWARQMAEELADEQLLALVLLSMGQLEERSGELQQACSLYEQGLAIARQLDDKTLMRDFLVNLGEATLNHGEREQAERYVREGLSLCDDGARQQKCKLLKTLGEVVDYRGDFVQADALYRESLTIAQDIHDNEMVMKLLQNLGTKAYKEGQYKQANSRLREGLKLARDMGHRHRESALLTNMGMVAIKQEKFAQAEKYCERGLSIARSINNTMWMSNALQNLGILEGMRDNGQRAEEYLQESIDLARTIEHQWLISEGLCALGEVYLRQSKNDDARDTFDHAFTLAQEKGFQELLAYSLFGQACLAKERQDSIQARELAEKSLALLQSEGHYRAAEVAAWIKGLDMRGM